MFPLLLITLLPQDRAAVPLTERAAETSTRNSGVDAALEAAGENREQIQRFLAHCRDSGDAERLAAAEFLVANMPGHGFIEFELRDERGEPHAFDALAQRDLAGAQATWDALEREYGPLDFERARFASDLEHADANVLVEHVEYALRAWRERPWARAISFGTFCRWILPYRGSNEPLEAWRKSLYERYANLPNELGEPESLQAAWQRVHADVDRRIRFDDIYYLHPTDQACSEMETSKRGRCEDITNYLGYAMRANAIPFAADYTPWWADRDNNHAWEVLLDVHGHGRAGLSNRAAKVYRKTYERQPGALSTLKSDGESVPRWLDNDHYLDVTEQYVATSDVELALDPNPDAPQRFAYLCVFNGGEWRPIQWASVASGRARFERMGRDIAYLPAWYIDSAVVPAGHPFVLGKDGAVRGLQADRKRTLQLEVTSLRPATPDADTRRDLPVLRVESGKSYELFVCAGEWLSVGKLDAGNESVRFDAVPAYGLYWLVETGSRKLERIFTLEGGKQIWY
jgi:hypothetical protein